MPLLSRARSFAFLVLSSALLTSNALGAPVSSGGTGLDGFLTDLGSFAAGVYRIAGSGVVDLTGGAAGGVMQMNPDGTPKVPVTWAAYQYFNPNGSFIADGAFGAAGDRAKIGALIGTLTTNPATPSDWFLIGYGTTVTLSGSQHIYASVNDTFHQNNTGSFEATVSAVPEPTSAALLILGFMACLFVRNRRTNRPALVHG